MAEDGESASPAVPSANPIPQPLAPVDAVAGIAVDEIRKQVPQVFGQFGLQVGPAPHPFAAQITSEHIASSITAADQQDKRSHDSQRLYFIGGASTIVLLSAMFLYAGQVMILEKIILAFIGFASGFVGGYGFAKRKG